ncbi:hypothetical protein CJ030_MR0G027464 [Morella rubra]|uniref:Uncharacterized protein n=1 Tax=Morella rubra TaxID=262757 RepID=A0A6A1UFM1_9ROSI|nr:hypothetical protein CJ030_MR0G027464 [Morella rubra]
MTKENIPAFEMEWRFAYYCLVSVDARGCFARSSSCVSPNLAFLSHHFSVIDAIHRKSWFAGAGNTQGEGQSKRISQLPTYRSGPWPKRHFTASFPGYDVVPWDFFSFSVARVLHDACVELSEELGGVLYGLLELGLVSLVRVDAEQHVLPPHEVELRGRVVETCDTENVPDSVSVQPRLWLQSAAMRREQGTKAKNLYALSEAAEHLAVHALKRIGANGRCREKQRRYRVLSRNYNREQHYMPSRLG